MGRGIARKFETTKKCSCENPQWFADDIEVNGNTKEITYILTCRNCKAIWKTKSHDARRYWAPLQPLEYYSKDINNNTKIP